MPKKPTIGKLSYKAYRCRGCGHEKEEQTNHWGEIYPYCSICCKQTVWECLDPVPEGYAKPKPWKFVKLGDIAEVKIGRAKP